MSDPVIRRVRRAIEDATTRGGMIVGMPKVTIDANDATRLCLMAEMGSEIEELRPAQQGSVPEAVIKAAVERFLCWKLPEDFFPDGGVSFDRAYEHDSPHWPVGTNILTAEQAEHMFRDCLLTTTPQPEGDGWKPNSEGPTGWEFRFVEALRNLCGGEEPPDRLVKGWLTHENDELQGWVVSNCTFHWAMGATVIDAAMALADGPEEGAGHDLTPPQPPQE